MIVYIDENFPPQLAKGLDSLQEPLNRKDRIPISIVSIAEEFGQGVKDEDWIPLAGNRKAIVITQDLKIQRTRHQRDLYRKHKLGIFFFKPPSKTGYTYWQMVQQVIKRWEEMKRIMWTDKVPFAYRCTSLKNFEKLEE